MTGFRNKKHDTWLHLAGAYAQKEAANHIIDEYYNECMVAKLNKYNENVLHRALKSVTASTDDVAEFILKLPVGINI